MTEKKKQILCPDEERIDGKSLLVPKMVRAIQAI